MFEFQNVIPGKKCFQSKGKYRATSENTNYASGTDLADFNRQLIEEAGYESYTRDQPLKM